MTLIFLWTCSHHSYQKTNPDEHAWPSAKFQILEFRQIGTSVVDLNLKLWPGMRHLKWTNRHICFQALTLDVERYLGLFFQTLGHSNDQFTTSKPSLSPWFRCCNYEADRGDIHVGGPFHNMCQGTVRYSICRNIVTSNRSQQILAQ